MFFCFGYIGNGLGDSTRLLGTAVDDRLAAAYLFDGPDHFLQTDPMMVSYVDNLKRCGLIVNSGHDPLHDVLHVCIVPAAASIPVNGNGVPLDNITGEFMDRQVRALPGAVNREKTQGDETDIVQMHIGMSGHFTR